MVVAVEILIIVEEEETQTDHLVVVIKILPKTSISSLVLLRHKIHQMDTLNVHCVKFVESKVM